MSAEPTVEEVWRALGFDATLARDPAETVRAEPDAARQALAALRRDDETRASPARAPDDAALVSLPLVSVDLPSTQGDPAPRRTPGVGRPELEVLGLLGEGGMGRVYVARQRSLGREVALKTLREGAPEADRAALVAEGAITGSLEHPGIVPVHGLGLHADGRPVLVMKRVEGVTWSVLLRDAEHPAWARWGADSADRSDPSSTHRGARRAAGDETRRSPAPSGAARPAGPVAPAGTGLHRLDGHLAILSRVCDAVAFANSRGVVHRDIKPSNVLIGTFGDVYLADWGVAERAGTVARRIVGTPAYMAPEMATGERVDARTDVYLLGATLHEVLTGEPRHAGAGIGDVLRAAALSLPADYPPSVPAALAELARRATARRPEDRPESAEAFRRALADYLSHRASLALADAAAARVERLRALSRSEAPEDRAELDRLTAEVGFAVAQALESWASNPVAARVRDEVERLQEARRARAAELERLARDLDPSVGARQRAIAMAVVTLGAIGTLARTAARGLDDQPPPRALFVESLGPSALLAVAVVALNRRIAASAATRGGLALLAIGIWGISLGRGLGWLAGATPAGMILADLVLLTAVTFAGGIVNGARFAAVSALPLAAAVAAALDPTHANFLFTACASALGVAGVLFVLWQGRAAPSGAPRAGGVG